MEFGCGCYTIILVITGILSSLTFKDKAIGVGIFVLLLAIAVGYLKTRDKVAEKVNEKMSEDTRRIVNIAKIICVIIIVCMLFVLILRTIVAVSDFGGFLLDGVRDFFNHFY